MYDKTKQFRLQISDFLDKLDFVDWYRYFFIIKEVHRIKPNRVLEVGEGGGIIRRVTQEYTDQYDTLDVNTNLSPTYISDVRKKIEGISELYDCIIAADILEHIPFEDLVTALRNLGSYVKPGGTILITIPHRASYFLFMSPTNVPHVFRIPTGFLSPGAFYRRFIKRKIWIDPDHQWEIGDGIHSIADVERVIRETGLSIEARKTLFYVDFWILNGPPRHGKVENI